MCDYDRVVLKILIPAFSSPLLLETQLRAVKAYLPAAEIWVAIDTKPGIFNDNRNKMLDSAKKFTPFVVAFPELQHFSRKRIHPNSRLLFSRSPSTRHADVLQYCFNEMSAALDFELLVLDEDMIPFKPWSPSTLLGADYFGLCVPQSRAASGASYVYPWPGLFYVNLSKSSRNDLISWDTFHVGDLILDSGGSMKDWYAENLNGFVPIVGYHSDHWSVQSIDVSLPPSIRAFLESDILPSGNNFSELYSDSFIHLRGSSNWFKHDAGTHSSRLKTFCLRFEELLG